MTDCLYSCIYIVYFWSYFFAAVLHSLEVFCPSFHSYNIQDSIARISSEKNETQIIYYRSSCSKNVRPEIPYQNTIVQVVSHYMLCTICFWLNNKEGLIQYMNDVSFFSIQTQARGLAATPIQWNGYT